MTRISRDMLADIWFDVFDGERMEDQLPARSKNDCVRELIVRARERNRMDAMVVALCDGRVTSQTLRRPTRPKHGFGGPETTCGWGAFGSRSCRR